MFIITNRFFGGKTMPKIIENLTDDILEKAAGIIENDGIEKLSIRRLSSDLGIAASTIYNYYDGKEALINAAAMKKWEETLAGIDEICSSDSDVIEILSMITDRIRVFFRPFFLYHISHVNKNEKGGKTIPDHPLEYRNTIYSQLSSRVEGLLKSRGYTEDDAGEMATVLTKLTVLTMHGDDVGMEDIVRVIKKLIQAV